MTAQTQQAPAPKSELQPRSTRPMSPTHAAWLIAEREITTKLRSKAFIISTAVMLLLVLGAVIFGGIMSSTGGFGDATKVAAPAQLNAQLVEAGFDVTSAEGEEDVNALVEAGDVDAGVVLDDGVASGVMVVGLDDVPTGLVQALSITPEIVLLDPTSENPFLAYIIAVAFGVVFMFSALTFGTTIAQSVVEEKQTRIVEILLATVSARTILAGKILGNSILALSQVLAIGALSSVGMLATGQDLLLGELGSALIWFAILFAFGFVLLAALYSALASLVSRQEDVPSATSPVMWLVMLPYIAIIMFNSDLKILAIMSYIPFSAPVGMPMRLYLGAAEWWEPFASLGVLVATIAVVWWLGARIYEGSILRTGGRVKLRDALKAAV